jgi:hypothetical protein
MCGIAMAVPQGRRSCKVSINLQLFTMRQWTFAVKGILFTKKEDSVNNCSNAALHYLTNCRKFKGRKNIWRRQILPFL